MAGSPVLQNGNPLFRLPFSSPRLPSPREAPVTSTTIINEGEGSVGIKLLPKLDGSEILDSVNIPPACNRFKVASLFFLNKNVNLIILQSL